ncbi:MAG: purine-nucleoside phosphorylase [Thermoleophilaceae bacterium]|nr:purine-nucleoside phosphorylase [Thermoleophilaceae bacterium]
MSHIVLAISGRPIHLNPAAELADRVLLPGDPQRALTMAQALLEDPRMFNARRGLWGYTGTAPDGASVTIQSTGMGGPSAAIVVEELIDLGARTLIRTGTCGALDGRLELGQLIAVAGALADDGASRALGATTSAAPDAALTEALERAGGGAAVTVVSTDLFYDPRPGKQEAWRQAGAAAVEMEAATILTSAARRGVRAACLLLVSDVLDRDGRRRLRDDELEAGGKRLGEVALRSLAER